MKTHSGFSLIELLVTIVVMSILFALSLTILVQRNPEDAVDRAREEFRYFFEASVDEALLTGQLVRIVEHKGVGDSHFILQSNQSIDMMNPNATNRIWETVKDEMNPLVIKAPVTLSLSKTPIIYPTGQCNGFSVTTSLDNIQIIDEIDSMGRFVQNKL